jgi:hypothetical protein
MSIPIVENGFRMRRTSRSLLAGSANVIPQGD